MEGWRKLIPPSFTLDPAIAQAPEKEAPTPVIYSDIINGTREYQVEAILAMRL